MGHLEPTDLLKAPCQGFSSSYGAGAVEVELWGGVQGGEDTKLILASGHSPCSGQARHGRPFWGSSFNNIFFSDMNNPFCNPFSDSTHLSLVKSRIYSEEGLTSSQHASLLSLESLVPRLQSTNQSIFGRKLAFLVVSVYHNYLLSPPSCLGMTPLCWGRSRASQPPFLERLRDEVSQEQKLWMGRRTNIPAILNNFTNILDILSLSKENAKF